jgi:hypothetical protein
MTFSCVCLSLSLSVSLPAELQTVCKIFHKRISGLEADKYDLEWKNKMKYLEVNTARLRIEILFFFLLPSHAHAFRHIYDPNLSFSSLPFTTL